MWYNTLFSTDVSSNRSFWYNNNSKNLYPSDNGIVESAVNNKP